MDLQYEGSYEVITLIVTLLGKILERLSVGGHLPLGKGGGGGEDKIQAVTSEKSKKRKKAKSMLLKSSKEMRICLLIKRRIDG